MSLFVSVPGLCAVLQIFFQQSVTKVIDPFVMRKQVKKKKKFKRLINYILTLKTYHIMYNHVP